MEVYFDGVIENFYIAVTDTKLPRGGKGTYLDKEKVFLTSRSG